MAASLIYDQSSDTASFEVSTNNQFEVVEAEQRVVHMEKNRQSIQGSG